MCDTTAIKQAVFQGFYADLSLWSVMVGNPYRYRAVLPQLENRHATAGKREVRVIPFVSLIAIMIVNKETIKINYALEYAYIDGSFNDASSEYEELNSRMIVR
jgi:hypothetical protein